MVNEELRKALNNVYGELMYFDTFSYDASIIGISNDARVVYDYDKMIEELANDQCIPIEEAADIVSYDTLRALGYNTNSKRPIVVFHTNDFTDNFNGER